MYTMYDILKPEYKDMIQANKVEFPNSMERMEDHLRSIYIYGDIKIDIVSSFKLYFNVNYEDLHKCFIF